MNGSVAIRPDFPRERLLVAALAIPIIFVAWLYLWIDARRMGVGECLCMPDMQPWSALNLAALFGMWSVMMAGMMTPSVAPTLVVFAKVNASRREQGRSFVSTGFFLLGYLAAWTGFSAIAAALQWALHARALLSPAMVSTSPVLGGAIVIASGIFQWTPLKRACLVHCRTPLQFLLTEWREGASGAFVMGFRHGAYCVGCCWVLMALLFVCGVMNLLWIAILSVLVLAEKLAPASWRLSRWIGFALVIWGAWILRSAFTG